MGDLNKKQSVASFIVNWEMSEQQEQLKDKNKCIRPREPARSQKGRWINTFKVKEYYFK